PVLPVPGAGVGAGRDQRGGPRLVSRREPAASEARAAFARACPLGRLPPFPRGEGASDPARGARAGRDPPRRARALAPSRLDRDLPPRSRACLPVPAPR